MASLEVSRFKERDSEAWDRFVESANNGTLFHTRKFLGYHPPDRFTDHSLIFWNGSKIAAVFPAAEYVENEARILHSHPGASYGGWVVPRDIHLKRSFDLVQALIRYARSENFRKIDLTFAPIFYSHEINNYLDFSLFMNGFTYRKREVSSFVTLNFTEDTVLQKFKPESRTAVRRAMKLGVTIRDSNDFPQFYEILKKNLKMRHNVQPTHTLDELLLLKKMFPDKIHLYGAYLDDRIIAGVVMFHCNPLVNLAFYISHDEAYQQYRPVNLLFYEVFKKTIRQGFRYFDFGIFTVNMEPNWGLARFKENFGSKGIFRDTFVKVL
ncbi:MAG: GNAT family N-acetyltransferase [Calditrichaeota bacterium]|nr:GNAT family N-acetyltransferase [Calditrichota bacterium]